MVYHMQHKLIQKNQFALFISFKHAYKKSLPSSPLNPDEIPSDWLNNLASYMLSLLNVGLAKPSAIFSEISRPCSLYFTD